MHTPIYEGAVHDPAQAGSAPLFHYERRVASEGDALVATHLTRDARGALAVVESARVGDGYALQRFEADQRQLGWRASVEVSAGGRRLDFRLEQGGRVRTATRHIADPAVSGPSLHGWILAHWDALQAGGRLRVAMVVASALTAYPFEIRLVRRRDGLAAFSVTPARWWLRLAVAPLVVTFNAATRHVVRYEGRVPPLRAAGRRLRAFDARVDYTMRAAAYR